MRLTERRRLRPSGSSKGSAVPSLLRDVGVSPEEWQIAVTQRPNVLLTGASCATSQMARALIPALRKPVSWCDGRCLSLPSTPPRTLIVHHAADLSAVDQQQLLDWLSDVGTSAQIVTTASPALFLGVQCGTFLEALYYRLNVLCLTDPAGSEQDVTATGRAYPLTPLAPRL